MDVPGSPNEISIQAQNGQNVQDLGELNVRLYDASKELERERRIAEFQRHNFQVKLQELRYLLNTTLRERDEARQQLFRLKQILAKHSFQALKPFTTSQGRIQWVDNHQGKNSTSPVIDELRWVLPDHQNGLEIPPNEHNDCVISADQHLVCSNLAEKRTHYQQQHDKNLVFLDAQAEAPSGQHPSESPLLRLMEDPITDQDVWQQNSKTSKAIGISETITSSGHMSYHHHNQLENARGIIPLSPQSMPLHLPAPPEADMQVILNTLPEKGKLMQAVMQAGPLLQDLLKDQPLPQTLSTGESLPRWTNPPPELTNVKIPILCLGSMHNPLPIDFMQVHDPTPENVYFPHSNFHATPNHVACTRNPTDFQHSHTASSSANFKSIFTAMPPDCVMKARPKIPKFRPTKNTYQDTHSAIR